ACRDTRCGFARRLASSAPVIANAVFDIIGIVGMARPVLFLDVGIILRALIDIGDQQGDGCPGGYLDPRNLVDERTGKNFHFVGFMALAGEPRLARAPFVQVGLDIGLAQRNARRAAIHHTADRGPMALAKSSYSKKMAESIERH